MNLSKNLVVLLTIVLIASCGGGGKSTSSNVGDSDQVVPLQLGKFSNVEGVYYETSSGKDGYTDGDGGFEYQEGDDVSFYVGEAELGTIPAAEEITVFSFAKPDLVNQILYSLDDDKNPENGFNLSHIEYPEQTEMQRLSVDGAVATAGGSFVVDEVTSFDPKYSKFLSDHNANIFSKDEALADEFIKIISEYIDTTKSPEKGSSFAKPLLLGTSDYLPIVESESALANNIEGYYASKDYAYRINLATLSKMYTVASMSSSNKTNSVLDSAEERKKVADDFEIILSSAISTAFAVDDYVNGKGKDAVIGASQTGVNFLIEKNTDGAYKPAAKIASSMAFECVAKGEAVDCGIDYFANKVSLVAHIGLNENDPLLATIDAGAGVFADTAKAWISCAGGLGSKPTPNQIEECGKDLFNAGIMNTYKLVSTSAQLAHLTSDLQDVNNASLAFQYLMVTKYLQFEKEKGNYLLSNPSPCEAITYYPNDDSVDQMKTCEDLQSTIISGGDWKIEDYEKKIVKPIIEAIVKSGKVHITGLSFRIDYDFDEVLNYIDKYQNEYSDIYKKYNAHFKKYLGDDGKINSDVVDVEIKSATIFEISDDVTINQNESGTFDVTACVSVSAPAVLELSDISIQLLKYGNSGSNAIILEGDTPTHLSKGKHKICGKKEDIDIIGWQAAANYGEPDPFLVHSKLEYRYYKSLYEAKYYTKSANSLFIQRYVPEIETEITITDGILENGNMFFSSKVVDGRQKVSKSYEYYYHWVVDTVGCDTNYYKTEVGTLEYEIPEKCRTGNTAVYLEVNDKEYGDLLGFNYHPVDIAVTLNDDLSLLVKDFVINNNATKKIEPEVFGGTPPYEFDFALGNGLVLLENFGNSIKVEGDNEAGALLNTYVTVTVTDEADGYVSKNIPVSVHTAPTEASISLVGEYPKSNSPIYPKIGVGENINKTWVLKNPTIETLKDVALVFDSEFSNTMLGHSFDDIIIGDILPGEEKTASLNIYAPDDSAGSHNLGKYSIYYTDAEGNKSKIRFYPSRESATVKYTFKVESGDIYPPVITSKSISINGNYAVVEFDISQKNNLVKNLRACFSQYSSYPDSDAQCIDIGGNYEALQSDGTKALEINLNKWQGKKVYWEITATNQSGIEMETKQTGVIYVPIWDLVEITYVSDVSAGTAGDNFYFECTLSDQLPDGYSLYINFGRESEGFLGINDPGGYVLMDDDCTLTQQINGVGNRIFRIGIFDEQDNLLGDYSQTKGFVVQEPESEDFDCDHFKNSAHYSTNNIFYSSSYAPQCVGGDGYISNLGNSKGNCTWYVNGRLQELGFAKSDIDMLNQDATKWAGLAENAGYEVNKNPAVRAVAYAGADYGSYSSYGHVAIVEKVFDNGTIQISESSYDSPGSSWDFLYRTRIVNVDEFQYYIHIGELNLPEIDITNLQVNPNSGYVGDSFNFSCDLSEALPGGYSLFANFGTESQGYLGQNDDGGHVPMADGCSLTVSMNTAGARLFRVGIFDSNNNQVGSYSSGKGFEVQEVGVPEISNLRVNPDPGTAGNNFSFRCDLSEELPADYTLYANFGTAPGNYLSKTDPGGHVEMESNCTLIAPMSEAGSRLFRIGIFDSNDNQVGNYSNGKGFTVGEIGIPQITNLQVNPSSGNAGDNFSFSCDLSEALPNGYSLYANFGSDAEGYLDKDEDGGHVPMEDDCALTAEMNGVGDRLFRVGIFDSNGNIVGEYSSGKSFIVNEARAPDLIVSVTTDESTYSVGETLRIAATIENQGTAISDASTVKYYFSSNSTIGTNDTEIGTDSFDSLSQGSSTSENIRYVVEGGIDSVYVGACVVAVSGESNTSNNCSSGKKIYFEEVIIPQISNLQVNPSSGYSGEDFDFSCSLSGSLPSGYDLYVNFGGSNGFLDQGDLGGHVKMSDSCSLTQDINGAGNRKFRVGIFDSNDDLVGDYSSSKSFTVHENGDPDLTVSVSTSKSTYEVGGALYIEATVRNIGDGIADSSTLNYFWCKTSVISQQSNQCTKLTEKSSASLAPGESVDSEHGIRVTGTREQLWVGACVVEVSGESNAENNCAGKRLSFIE